MIDPNDLGTIDLIEACERPMTGAERQRAFRRRQRERKIALKAEGLHTLQLSSTDLGRLFIALDTHISFNQLLDWDLQGYRELATRLFKGETNGAAMVQVLGTSEGVTVLQKQRDKDAKRGWDSYHDERKRTARLRNELSHARAEVQRLQSGLQEIAAEMGGVAPAKPSQVEALTQQVAALQKEDGLLVDERTRAFTAAKVFEDRLRAAGLSTDCRRQPGE